MQIYLGGTIGSGLLPVIIALFKFFPDVWTYWNTRSTKNIEVWQVSVCNNKTYATYIHATVVQQKFQWRGLIFRLLLSGIPIWRPMVRLFSGSSSNPFIFDSICIQVSRGLETPTIIQENKLILLKHAPLHPAILQFLEIPVYSAVIRLHQRKDMKTTSTYFPVENCYCCLFKPTYLALHHITY